MKEYKGITLIALVVTIVVLIILAGISIGLLTGKNGMITKAQQSKEDSIIADEKEIIEIAYVRCEGENNTGTNVTDVQMEQELTRNGKDVEVITEEGDLEITFNDTKHTYIIDEEGNIEKVKDFSGETEKIVDIIACYNNKIYVLTESGEVKEADFIEGQVLGKLQINNENRITKKGVMKKGETWFIDNKGRVYTWGSNYSGQLGNGTTEDSEEIICISNIEGSPLKGKNIIDVYWENSNTVFAKDSNGKIYAWGSNYDGQLGNGTTTDSSIPICISDIAESALKGKNIVNIYNEESAILAIDSNGKLYVWGNGNYGILGIGTTEDIHMPICLSDIRGNALNGKNIEDIYASFDFVLVKDSNGKLYTWGSNYRGRLGDGTNQDRKTPICISDIEGNALKDKRISEICCYGSTVIVQDSNKKIYTWGSNSEGLLGNGKNENSNAPVCISDIDGSELNGKTISKVFCDGRTVFALDINGKMYTWGNNGSGQLGDGTTEIGYGKYRSTPICISDIEGNELEGKAISEIYLFSYTTVIVQDSDKKLYTWGDNWSLQLGNGTMSDSNKPLYISEVGECEINDNNICIAYSQSYRYICSNSKKQ